MTKISIKIIISMTLLLFINQTAFADNRSGHGNGGSRKSHGSSSHSIHRQKPVYRAHKSFNKPRFNPTPHRSGYYRPGHSTHYLPHGYNRVYSGNKEYFYFDGYFYSPFRNEYHIVDAPIGAIVLSLPRLHFSLQWSGIDFFLSGNTYYRRHPNGYVVVRNPGFRDDWW